MQSPLEPAIRERLADYLAGRLSLGEFKEWLVGATWEIPRGREADAMRLANAVKLAMDEVSGGFVSEGELRTDLEMVLRVSVIDASGDNGAGATAHRSRPG